MPASAADGCQSEAVSLLLGRARSLAGLTLEELARAQGMSLPSDPKREKGYVGRLVERALGVTAPASNVTDFPALGIELKTLPVDERGRPRESTFVCHVDLRRIADCAWESSRVCEKLARVLFVPVESRRSLRFAERRIGRAFLWTPSGAQLAALRGDYDEIVGRIGLGELDGLTGRVGCVLQVRPKAANARARARAADADGGSHDTFPRAFYLRASFTAALVADALEISPRDRSV
jgi:DNA mismatch repair protein MutH